MADAYESEFEPHSEVLAGPAPVNAFTVDVEEYFQVSALASVVDQGSWGSMGSRLEPCVEQILSMLDERQARGTFFVLGWIAEKNPNLIRRIAEQGHEVASHGYNHTRVTQQTPKQFQEDAGRTKGILEDTVGMSVTGYRAASFSIGADNLWALDVLADVGYTYSSSVYPVRHDLYGFPAAPRFAFRRSGGGILEIPISTNRMFGQNFPAGGGGYFRLLPYAVSKWAIRQINRRDRQPMIFYFHPWEIDPDQPRIPGTPLRSRIRHYLNLTKTKGRLSHLLEDFRWDRMDVVFAPSMSI